MSSKAKAERGPIGDIKSEGKKAAKEAAYSPLMDKLTRLGYGVKGVIYIIIGLLAIQTALGQNATPADQLGAIASIGKLPYGPLALWVVLIGLVSYSLWGLIRAFLDPFKKGKDTEGLLIRGGYLISAITYASFVWPTYQLIRGGSNGSQTSQLRQSVDQILSMPMGRVIVGFLALAVIAGGLYHIYLGISSNFDQQFKPYALTPYQLRIARQTGRFGTIARGVVFFLSGLFLFLGAYYANANASRGFDGVLKFLAGQPYGLWLLGIIAVGLIAFGIYSLMSAAWFRLKSAK